MKRLQGRLKIMFGPAYSNVLNIGIQSTGENHSSALFRVHTKNVDRQFNLIVELDGELKLREAGGSVLRNKRKVIG
jgi:hypothetical protein